jgi:hypothetical protein
MGQVLSFKKNRCRGSVGFKKRLVGAWQVFRGKAFAIKPLDRNDVLGEVRCCIGKYQNQISVSGRDVFFRHNGDFNGTGMSVSRR